MRGRRDYVPWAGYERGMVGMPKPTVYLTTSWDDGHPLDLRLADLLTKYGLSGTFYVPRHAECGTMSGPQLRQLAMNFELGAHTLHHPVLSTIDDRQAQQEIDGAKLWLEETTSLPCIMFCPPHGKYSGRHLRMVRSAGYLGVRSVELLSLDPPRPRSGLMLMPTSVQAYPHDLLAYARNTLKRASIDNLWRLDLTLGNDWVTRAARLLGRVLQYGGVFHVWGHSWEVEQNGQWDQLDRVLRLMSECVEQAIPLTNGQICQRTMALPA